MHLSYVKKAVVFAAGPLDWIARLGWGQRSVNPCSDHTPRWAEFGASVAGVGTLQWRLYILARTRAGRRGQHGRRERRVGSAVCAGARIQRQQKKLPRTLRPRATRNEDVIGQDCQGRHTPSDRTAVFCQRRDWNRRGCVLPLPAGLRT